MTWKTQHMVERSGSHGRPIVRKNAGSRLNAHHKRALNDRLHRRKFGCDCVYRMEKLIPLYLHGGNPITNLSIFLYIVSIGTEKIQLYCSKLNVGRVLVLRLYQKYFFGVMC
jgi:hypothetical protein